LISIGYFSKQSGILKKEHTAVVNNVIIYFAMPALIFRAVHQSHISIGLLMFPLVGNLVMLANMALAYVAARAIKLHNSLLGAVVLVATIGNTGFLGYPLTIELFGMNSLVKSVFFDLFSTVIFMFTVGILVAGKFGKAEGRVNVLKEVSTFPPLIAILIAIVLHGVNLPGFLDKAISFMAGAAIPLIMISIGLALEISEVKNYKRELTIISLLKLIMAPIFAILLSIAFGFSRTDLAINLLEASMPTFLFSYIIGQRYGLDIDFIPAAVVVTTMLSMATIPVWQYLINNVVHFM
jgi:auxin efflux carrier (AEC)